MYRGSAALGENISLSLWCRDDSGTPTLPVSAPLASVWSASAKVAEFKMPIHDRYNITGYFRKNLYLDAVYSAGQYRVLYQYTLGSTVYDDDDLFDVVADGHMDGGGISMHFYRKPTSDWVIYQGQSRILRRRNPAIV